jgi:hypothetical protein
MKINKLLLKVVNMKEEKNRQSSDIHGELERFIVELFNTGLSYINEGLMKNLDQMIILTSKEGLHRIAISLKYVKNELQRYTINSLDFDANRLLYFISQVYLLNEGIKKIPEKDDAGLKKKLIGSEGIKECVKNLKLRLIGLQPFNIQGSLTGFSIQFLCLSGQYLNEIFSWDYFKSAKGFQNPESMLSIKFPDLNFTIQEFFFQNVIIDECILDVSKNKIFFDQKSTLSAKIIENFPDLIEKFRINNLSELLDFIKSIEIVPFETNIEAKQYCYLENIKIINAEISDDKKFQNKKWNFLCKSDLDFEFFINIDDKEINRTLIENLNHFNTQNKIIDGFFGYLYLEDNHIKIYPLYSILDGKEYPISIKLSIDTIFSNQSIGDEILYG